MQKLNLISAKTEGNSVSHGLFGNNVALLTALAALVPEVNVRVALINTIDFLAQLGPGDEIERADLYEVMAQNLVWLHDHVGSDDEHDDNEDVQGISNMDEALAVWRKQLGIGEDDK